MLPDDEFEHLANEWWIWMAWEIAVARLAPARRVWDLAMKDYGLGSVSRGLDWMGWSRWSDITQSEKRAVILDRMKVARKRDIVDARGRAVWQRLPTLLPRSETP